MRRTASEIIRNLEVRVARLERQAKSDLRYVVATSKESLIAFHKYETKFRNKNEFKDVFLLCCAMKKIKTESKLNYLDERLGGTGTGLNSDREMIKLAKSICSRLDKLDVLATFIQINIQQNFFKNLQSLVGGILGVRFHTHDLQDIVDCMELMYGGMGITEKDFDNLTPTSKGYKLMTWSEPAVYGWGIEEKIKNTINKLKAVSSKGLLVESFNKNDISFV